MKFIEDLKSLVNTKNPKSLHIHLKKIDKEKLKKLTYFLPEDSTVGTRVFHLVNDICEIPKCSYCGKDRKKSDMREYSVSGYINTCEKLECKDKYHKEYNSPSINVKRKYGIDSISQTKEWHDKVKQTNLERRGVEWNTQSDKFIKARQKSWEEHGDEQMAKRIDTNNIIYGCDHGLSNKNVIQKSIETCLLKYECERPLQNEEILNKLKNTNEARYGSWFLSTQEARDASIAFYKKNSIKFRLRPC